MSDEFEIVPFADGGGALESERGGRGGARAIGRPGKARPAWPRSAKAQPTAQGWPQPAKTAPPAPGWARPQHQYGPGWPRPHHQHGPGWPWWRGPRYPAYGAWPWDVVVAEPYPVPVYGPAAEPYPEPGYRPDPGPGPEVPGPGPGSEPEDEYGMHGEAPPALQDTLARLPAAARPNYIALGTLASALSDARAAGPGLYVIEFTVAGRPRAYSGQSRDLRRRLRQHVLCAQMLGVPVAGHRVYVAPLPGLTPAQRRALEQRIHADMFARHAGVLTNQRRELEFALLGEAWL